MTLLGIDVGTTHCKAGLFHQEGQAVRVIRREMPLQRTGRAHAAYDPEAVWETVAVAVAELVADAAKSEIGAVGIASMAETGLLLDGKGRPRSPLLAWFDAAPSPQATRLAEIGDLRTRFLASGIYPSFKCSLAKILWWRERHEAGLDGLRWLSVADYIAYRLTGAIGTDYSLAGRTYAFCLEEAAWDRPWLESLGLPPDLFPPAQPAGVPVGQVQPPAAAVTGLAPGVPVAIAGHDHVCAAFATGAVQPGVVLDSMGTAESLLGAMAPHPLGDTEYESGLTFGRHTARDRYYWLGGLSSSGGAVEWLRRVLGERPLSYAEVAALLEESEPGPGSLLFFPYLSGSGAPQPDPGVRGALVGLDAGHGRAEIARAVFEGTAYQMEAIRRAAEALVDAPIERVVVAGGGAHNRPWLQIKADVTGCPHAIAGVVEAVALGAALLAGIGAGIFAGEAEALAAAGQPSALIRPDGARHEQYRRHFEALFLPWQEPLRHYRSRLGEEGSADE